MGVLGVLLVVAALAGFVGFHAGVERGRRGTSLMARAVNGMVRCLACRVPVAATQTRLGTCGDPRCVAAVEAGRARMDASRAATGDMTCDLTPTRFETRGSAEQPVEWSARWRSRR